MNSAPQFAIKLTTLAATIALAGCLSASKDDASSFSADPSPPPSSNRAPTISGAPSSSVLMGDQYSFTPSATDADNDPLTFSVSGEPAWLSINSANGALSGTPTLADVGTYPGIVVSVSDGSLSASLPQFTVTVVQNADGSVTLSWTAPTLNEDGTALVDLAGYTIYYGTSSRNYTKEVPVDPSMTTVVVNNLTPNTYYFAASARNLSGVESRLSDEAINTVN